MRFAYHIPDLLSGKPNFSAITPVAMTQQKPTKKNDTYPLPPMYGYEKYIIANHIQNLLKNAIPNIKEKMIVLMNTFLVVNFPIFWGTLTPHNENWLSPLYPISRREKPIIILFGC